MPSPHTKLSRTSLFVFAVFIALPVLYVLSYPIALRMYTSRSEIEAGQWPPELWVYAPVESVIFRNERAFDSMLEWSELVGSEPCVQLRLFMHQWEGTAMEVRSESSTQN